MQIANDVYVRLTKARISAHREGYKQGYSVGKEDGEMSTARREVWVMTGMFIAGMLFGAILTAVMVS